jgi:hypothetical protein
MMGCRFYRLSTRSLTQLETFSRNHEITLTTYSRGINLVGVCSFPSLEALSLKAGGIATLAYVSTVPKEIR